MTDESKSSGTASGGIKRAALDFMNAKSPKAQPAARKASGAGPASLDIVIRVNDKEVSKGHVPRSASGSFTANDAFDVGRDSYSPVSLAYFDRKPFAFNGKINRLKVEYLN